MSSLSSTSTSGPGSRSRTEYELVSASVEVEDAQDSSFVAPYGDDESSMETLGLTSESQNSKSVCLLRAPPQRCSPCGPVRMVGSLMMVVVMGLILISYVPIVYYYGDGTSSGAWIVIVFHVLISFTIVSYLQTALTDPGTVPMEWHARVAKMSSHPYYRCRRCDLFKPPRSHFDSVTQRLVLNMDHFCPWVNNCVGYYNRKFFIQFVGYTCIAAIYASVCLFFLIQNDRVAGLRLHISSHGAVKAEPTYDKSAGEMSSGADSSSGGNSIQSILDSIMGDSDFSLAMMTLLAAVIDGVFSICLAIFFGAHMWMAARNQTSIEGIMFSRQFDLGYKQNFQQVFGKRPLYWFLPLYGDGPVGDGIHWPLADGSWAGLTEDRIDRAV